MSGISDRLARAIARAGPIPVAQYMAEANAHYYATRDPLGAAGDFTTAPEIHQMFGEMIGIWCADLWQRAGKPQRVLYVEPGPGRGTLARDALRVMARFGLQPEVHLIETSPTLRARQAEMVPGAVWHDDLAGMPEDAPLLLVANEFLDALPVRQIVRVPAGWRERMVGMINGGFVPVAGDRLMDAAVPPLWASAPEGAVIETCPAGAAFMGEVGRRLAAQGGGALVIDYGHAEPTLGSTLQAVRDHARADPFAAPGQADLTALVDFAAMRAAAEALGARALGVTGQGAWLSAMGIAARAKALMQAAPERARDVAVALHRLTAAEAMGELFKVLALGGAGWPDGSGFFSEEQ